MQLEDFQIFNSSILFNIESYMYIIDVFYPFYHKQIFVQYVFAQEKEVLGRFQRSVLIVQHMSFFLQIIIQKCGQCNNGTMQKLIVRVTYFGGK